MILSYFIKIILIKIPIFDKNYSERDKRRLAKKFSKLRMIQDNFTPYPGVFPESLFEGKKMTFEISRLNGSQIGRKYFR